MRIGIFGGTFNPPHIAHVQAAQTAAEQKDIDLLLVIPAGVPPHKPIPAASPSTQNRLEMTRNAFATVKYAKVSDIEINSNEINFTIDTVKKLQNEYPDSKLFLLVGNDMYGTIDTWKDYQQLLQSVMPVLLPRDVINISSSEIRQMLPQRKGREFLADVNYSYIIKNRLYAAKPDFEWLGKQAELMLSPLRIPHVRACEVEAVRLAERWGADPDDAREAAILHDITKKLDFSQNMCIIAEHGITDIIPCKHEEKLLHAITGSLLAKSEFGVSDTVADAIKWHTTGRAQMSMLEKVIYIADYIEATRVFPGVDKLRQVAYEDIDAAMYIGLEMTVSDLKARGITPNRFTNEALAELEK